MNSILRNEKVKIELPFEEQIKIEGSVIGVGADSVSITTAAAEGVVLYEAGKAIEEAVII